MITYQGFWVYITTIIVFNRTLDSTLYRIWLRIVGTIIAGGISVSIMLSPYVQTNPYILCVFLEVWTGIAVFLGHGHRLKQALLLFLLTMYLIIACQYGAAVISWQFGVARTITVFAGSMLALLVNALVFPQIGSLELRSRLSHVVAKAGVLFSSLMEVCVLTFLTAIFGLGSFLFCYPVVCQC